MELVQALAIIIIFIGIVTTKDGLHSFVYYKIPGKRLFATPFQIVRGGTERKCLGFCVHTENCKSFNVRPGSANQSAFCELFNVNRCEVDIMLIDATKIDYFDTIPNGECPGKQFSNRYICNYDNVG